MGLYGVKALATYTGVNAHTLRIWERRYGVVKPARTPNGRRAYTQADADRLCLIAELTNKGHAISSIASLSMAELEKMLGDSTRSVRASEGLRSNSVDSSKAKVSAMFLNRMVTALEAFHLRDLSGQLATSRMNFSVTDFIYQIVLPLIARIGMLVNEERLSIAHEHALSAILKTQIYQSIYHIGQSRSRYSDSVIPHTQSVVIATQEGDHHEFGILLASLLAESRGLSTHFFGCNMPAKSLAEAANALQSPIVLVGRTIRMPVVSATGDVISQKEYLKELDRSLLAKTEIWIGGVLEEKALTFRARHKLIHLKSLEQLDKRFSTLV